MCYNLSIFCLVYSIKSPNLSKKYEWSSRQQWSAKTDTEPAYEFLRKTQSRKSLHPMIYDFIICISFLLKLSYKNIYPDLTKKIYAKY